MIAPGMTFDVKAFIIALVVFVVAVGHDYIKHRREQKRQREERLQRNLIEPDDLKKGPSMWRGRR